MTVQFPADVVRLKLAAIRDVAEGYRADPLAKTVDFAGGDGNTYTIVPCPGGFLFVWRLEKQDHVVAFARDDEAPSIERLLKGSGGAYS